MRRPCAVPRKRSLVRGCRRTVAPALSLPTPVPHRSRPRLVGSDRPAFLADGSLEAVVGRPRGIAAVLDLDARAGQAPRRRPISAPVVTATMWTPPRVPVGGAVDQRDLTAPVARTRRSLAVPLRSLLSTPSFVHSVSPTSRRPWAPPPRSTARRARTPGLDRWKLPGVVNPAAGCRVTLPHRDGLRSEAIRRRPHRRRRSAAIAPIPAVIERVRVADGGRG